MDELEKNQGLQDLVLTVHHAFMNTLMNIILLPEPGMIHKFRKCKHVHVGLAHFDSRYDKRPAQDIGPGSRRDGLYSAHHKTDILGVVVR